MTNLRLVRITFYPITVILTTALLLLLSAGSVLAGDVTLSNNAGSGLSTWFISGERSLIINGFNLEDRGLNLPVSVDRVRIEVLTASGGPVDVVVYGDANGGSPVDATLLRQESISISSAGTFTYTFADPVEVNTPVVWIGFYLPVDFEFYADTSGSSTLTYWAWTPGSEFNLGDLGSASVLGPANGSSPVSIDMQGIARITAEVITDGTVDVPTNPQIGTPISEPDSFNYPQDADVETDITQIIGDDTQNFAVMQSYGDVCSSVFYDTADVNVTYRQGVRWFCKEYNVAYSPEAPEGWLQAGDLFDVYVFGVTSGTRRLPYPVTHCLATAPGDLNRAIIGLAYGAPREWDLLPTVRFSTGVCAEVQYAGFITYFVPN